MESKHILHVTMDVFCRLVLTYNAIDIATYIQIDTHTYIHTYNATDIAYIHTDTQTNNHIHTYINACTSIDKDILE